MSMVALYINIGKKIMQLFALDLSKKPVYSGHAIKQRDYTCIECGSPVRLRGGMHRQNHFFHLEPNRQCRQHGKGMVHLRLQLYLLSLLPQGESQMEFRFDSIGRIADVAWHTKNIVFEIQYSPIKAEEIRERNRDYYSVGWQTVWILHDNQFNQKRLAAAEIELRDHPHYFSDMDTRGIGSIYDQFDIHYKGFRREKMGPVPVQLDGIKAMKRGASLVPQFIEDRVGSWPIFFRGDLVEQAHLLNSPYLVEAYEREQKFLNTLEVSKPGSVMEWVRWLVYRGIVRPYLLWFQLLLERLCR